MGSMELRKLLVLKEAERLWVEISIIAKRMADDYGRQSFSNGNYGQT